MPSDKSLQKAMNGFPAQTYHKDASSYKETHGSDNAAHMKVTDPNTGEPIDPREVTFPEDMNVNVVKELESVKAELQALKEHTFNTRLSGSNEEEGIWVKQKGDYIVEEISEPVEIMAGGNAYVDFDTNCSMLTVGVQFDSGDNHNITLLMYPQLGGVRGTGSNNIKVLEGETGGRALMTFEKIETISPETSFRILNNGAATTTYTLHLMKHFYSRGEKV